MGLMYSVLINGLTNAMKFCQSGSITVRLNSLAGTLVVKIIDTGVGFDEDEMPLVFQAFKKLDINSPGAGLGLHITKAMLEKAGGSLSLRSKKGSGTTFEATLPVAWAESGIRDSTFKTKMNRKQIRPTDRNDTAIYPVVQDQSIRAGMDSPLPSPSSIPSLSSTPSLSSNSSPTSTASGSTGEDHHPGKLRVLIVDDNHICLTLLSMSLRKGLAHIDLREAHSGSQAVDMHREFHPHLVLTDVCMPGMDGIIAAESMRKHEQQERLPRSAIYAVTALGETDSRSKSKGLNGSADLDGWLVKGQDLASVARDIAHRLAASDRQSV
jgi:CheY-like chemotaxis protein